MLAAAELPRKPEALKPAEAVDAYLAVVEDKDQTPLRRNYAAAQIVKLGDDAVDRILERYRDGSHERRGYLAEMLARMKNPSAPAVETLHEDLKKNRLSVHPNVVRALGDLECTASAGLLLELLPRADDEMRPTVLRALGRLADERAVDVLLTGLDSPDRAVSAVSADGVIRVLLKLKAAKEAKGSGSPYRQTLTKTLEYIEHGKCDKVRRVLVDGMGRAGDRRAADVLRRVLRVESEPLQVAAARSLGQLKDLQAVDGLADTLFTEKTSLKRASLDALAAIGDDRCVPVLIDRLDVAGARERRDIVKTLQQVTRQRFGDNPVQWRQWWQARS